MSNFLTGILKEITPTETLLTKAGKEFQKRTVILDNSYTIPNTGDLYENIVAFEVSGSRCAEFDQYMPLLGKRVDITFAVNGRQYTDRQGQTRHMVTLRPMQIFLHQSRQQDVPQQPSPEPQQDGQPSPQLQQAVYQSMGYTAPQAPQQGMAQQADDLPF